MGLDRQCQYFDRCRYSCVEAFWQSAICNFCDHRLLRDARFTAGESSGLRNGQCEVFRSRDRGEQYRLVDDGVVGFCDALVPRRNSGRWLRRSFFHSAAALWHEDDSEDRNERHLRRRGGFGDSADRDNFLKRICVSQTEEKPT